MIRKEGEGFPTRNSGSGKIGILQKHFQTLTIIFIHSLPAHSQQKVKIQNNFVEWNINLTCLLYGYDCDWEAIEIAHENSVSENRHVPGS